MIISNDKELYFINKKYAFSYFLFLNTIKTTPVGMYDLTHITDEITNLYFDIAEQIGYEIQQDTVFPPFVGVTSTLSPYFKENNFCPVVQAEDPDNKGDYEILTLRTKMFRTYTSPINISIDTLFFTEDIIKWESLFSRY